ncbi:hypothetical protein BCR36DRAFT_282571 [Piromyces finnis]|uniref:PB1 domain-containing protein n=1 Tax=Piromyces finnis TaxID=1754191 RepID=A0A1Y1VGZ2_9FUNG|nr:hypothetical protein BCR36DRAFT_282571 [Piromyces finnis]|eukprot:ORX54730.1 hypothetical protein BCR36DRAFT_282571 [Piromyces finnis]
MNRSLGELTYDELCVIVQRVWKSKLSTDINNLVLKYVDDEGDQICLESDIDVTHALGFSSCLKVHVYDKETIPTNSGSVISNLTLEEKSLESIKKVVENSRDTLNKVLEQLEKVKIEQNNTPAEKEIKPLSNDELNEFLGEQDETATKTTAEETESTPAVPADQTLSSAPPSAVATTNIAPAAPPATEQTNLQSASTHQGSLVQTPNSIHPTLTPQLSSYNQTTTPQLSQALPASAVSNQSYASPSTAYPPSSSQATATPTMNGQSAYQKTNSYSSNMSTQPVSQASATSSNMYASAPPTSYGTYSSTTSAPYGSTSAATSVAPSTTAANPYAPTAASTASNSSSYQRYPQTPTYGSSGMTGSTAPPPQNNAYGNQQNMQKPYGNSPYGAPYGGTSSSTYGNNPYNAYNSQAQNAYSRPNNGYSQNPNPYY